MNDRLRGLMTFVALGVLTVAVGLVFVAFRPPTVAEVERDIWSDWARATVDNQGENLAGLVKQGRREACQRIVQEFGDYVADDGGKFVLRTSVQSLRIRDLEGKEFASWSDPSTPTTTSVPWTSLTVPVLTGVGGESVGWLDVTFKFNESNLEILPNIERISSLHALSLGLLGILALVLLVALAANVQRLRERAARMQSQQATLDLARQMCHELRNGLWAFSLEGKNLRHLFDIVDEYLLQQSKAVEHAAHEVNLTERDRSRFARSIERYLRQQQLDPKTDVAVVNEMARDAQRQIESFTRYITLTVEQLDRNLLGSELEWHPEAVRLSSIWDEAQSLLELRFRSASVHPQVTIESDNDWVMADRRSLVHVTVNLAKNALEAMEDQKESRRLEIVIGRADGEVVFSMCNSGPPLSEEARKRMFTRGFSTKRGRGRGEGLSFVHHAITRMNGRIEVKSGESVTCFRIHLPAIETEDEAIRTASSQ